MITEHAKWEIFGIGVTVGVALCFLGILAVNEIQDRYWNYKRRKAERAALKYGRHSAGKVTEVKPRVKTATFPSAASPTRSHRPRGTMLSKRTDTTEFSAVSVSQTNHKDG